MKLSDEIKNKMQNLIVDFFNIFPIKKNKIFIFSYYGNQYGDSPKYISEYLVKNYPRDKFDIVWQFNDIDAHKDIEGVRMVKSMTLRHFYELCTSKIIITNFRTTKLFKKRKEQYYIQTWHSSLRLKQIEKDAENSLQKSYIEMAKMDSKKCDLLLSGCEYSTKIFKRAFWYDGKIFECGTPANDILFSRNNLIKEKILKKLKIDSSYKFILYAPTFRENKSLEIYTMNYEEVINTVSKRFGGKWILLLKLHPHMTNIAKDIKNTICVINVTDYDDIQELLVISDVLISDYSAVMFSFLLTRKPGFLYVPDLNNYLENDRKLYFNINELPFRYSKSNEELLENIANFDEEIFRTKVENMIDKIGTYESGEASRKVCDHIMRVIEGE